MYVCKASALEGEFLLVMHCYKRPFIKIKVSNCVLSICSCVMLSVCRGCVTVSANSVFVSLCGYV